jgi:hypothetical protein
MHGYTAYTISQQRILRPVNDQLELVIVGLAKRNVPILGEVLPVEK